MVSKLVIEIYLMLKLGIQATTTHPYKVMAWIKFQG